MRPGLALVILAAAASGCTEGGRPLVILQNLAPEEGCQFPAQAGADRITRGRIDVQAEGGYLFAPLVQNNAIGLADNPGARLALIEGADVELTLQEGFTPAADPGDELSFTSFFSGAIEPDGGLASFAFIVLTKQFMETYIEPALPPGPLLEINATITVFGQMGGSSTSSVPFHYPIEVCNGCMLVDVGACADLPADFEALEGGLCNTLQDVPLECCDGGTVCPAVPVPPA